MEPATTQSTCESMDEKVRWRNHKHSTLEDLRKDVAYMMADGGIKRQGPCTECGKKWHNGGDSQHWSRAERICSFEECGKIYCQKCHKKCHKCRKTRCKSHLVYFKDEGYCPTCIFTCKGDCCETKHSESHGIVSRELFKCKQILYDEKSKSYVACEYCPLCHPSKTAANGDSYCSVHFLG